MRVLGPKRALKLKWGTRVSTQWLAGRRHRKEDLPVQVDGVPSPIIPMTLDRDSKRGVADHFGDLGEEMRKRFNIIRVSWSGSDGTGGGAIEERSRGSRGSRKCEADSSAGGG